MTLKLIMKYISGLKSSIIYYITVLKIKGH